MSKTYFCEGANMRDAHCQDIGLHQCKECKKQEKEKEDEQARAYLADGLHGEYWQ